MERVNIDVGCIHTACQEQTLEQIIMLTVSRSPLERN